MKILFLTSRIPYPPNRGDRLRVYNFIRSLSREHEIHLLTFIEIDEHLNRVGNLSQFCKNIHTVKLSKIKSILNVAFNFWRNQPLQAIYYRSRKMQKTLDHLIQKEDFDLVYIHLFRMVPYIENWEDIYRVVDLTDVVSSEMRLSLEFRSGFSKVLYSIEKDRVAEYERQIAAKYEEIWLISEVDAQILRKSDRQNNIFIVRNGVNTGVFYPDPGVEKKQHQIIFVGHLSVPHNVDAAVYLAEDIFPLVKSRNSDAELLLVGAHPNPKVNSLGEIDGVQVTGFVDDLNRILNHSTVFVAPLRFAAGVQNKVLEACAAGLPVVTSPMVGNGIGLREYESVLYGSNQIEYAEHILGLFEDPIMRQRVAEQARSFVLKNYNWDLVNQRVNTIQSILLSK